MAIKQTYRILLLAGSCLLAMAAHAQLKPLRVYHASGNVVVQQPGQEENAKKGLAISKACIVKLNTPASRVMLIDSTGVYAILDRQGAYSFDSLTHMIKQLSRQGVTSKFFQYVWASFIEGHHNKEELANNVMAGVMRGNLPMKDPADSSIVSGDVITFHWLKERVKLPYRFILRDAATKKIIVNTVLKQELKLAVSVKEKMLQSGLVYQWSIDENDAKQPHNIYFSFLLAKPADMAAVKNDYRILSKAKFTVVEKRMISNDIFSKWMDFYKKR